MVNTLPSSVARWRSKKDIQENPKACEAFAFVRFQFPWHHRSYCFPKRLPFFAGFFWPAILCNPRPNRKCFGVNNSSFLTPWIKSDAYVSINLSFFFAETVFLLCFNKFFRNKTTDNGGILWSFFNSSIVGVQFNGGKILQ